MTEERVEVQSASAPFSDSSVNLRLRILTGLLAAGLLTVALCVPTAWPFFLICIFVAAIGLWELRGLYGWEGRYFLGALGVATLTLLLNVVVPGYLLLPLNFFGLLLGSWAMLFTDPNEKHRRSWLGVFWLVCPHLSLVAMCFWQTAAAPFSVLVVFLCIWASDTFALATGKLFGRNKLAPSLSPGKTWEGAIGGAIMACAFGWLFASVTQVGAWTGLGVGALCGILGPAGDLFESHLKRRIGVKDSGGLFPGHGGALDRIDSLLFASIPAAALILWQEGRLFHVKPLIEALFR